MITEKLFYKLNYQTKFTAKILDCSEQDGQYTVILDNTLFYPEGGGQPADTGTLGDAVVSDVREIVREIDNNLLHYVSKPLVVGELVNGEINWERRFSFMQSHTGEHIVSGIIKKLFNLDNVGFHIGTDFMTMDINGELTADNLCEVEILANKAVYQNVKIEAYFPTPDELSSMDYRSKKTLSGDIRIVSIPNYDACACCGLHCNYTGEVGLIKIISVQKYKGGMRLYMLCGQKALMDYIYKNDQAYNISAILSAEPYALKEAVEKLKTDYESVTYQNNMIKTELLRRKALDFPEGKKMALSFEENLSTNNVRQLCMFLCERTEMAIVFSYISQNEYKYAIASKSIDVRKINQQLNTAMKVRGGGQARLVQGTVYATKQEIEAFFSQLNQLQF